MCTQRLAHLAHGARVCVRCVRVCARALGRARLVGAMNRKQRHKRGDLRSTAQHGDGGERGASLSARSRRRDRASTSQSSESPDAACKLSLPASLLPGEAETCLTPRDVDIFAQFDTEWLWRFGFRRVVPGEFEDVRTALRPLRPRDTLLARYLRRWPKDDPPYQPPAWMHDEAETAEAPGAM